MEGHYVLVQENAIGSYIVQLWQEAGWPWHLGPQDRPVGQLVALLKNERPYALYKETAAVWLRDGSGTDLTGEGNPDVVIGLYSGGAHCCSSTIVYDLGDRATQVLETPYEDVQCEGHFEDLDGDGTAEFVTCDTSHFFFGELTSVFDCYNWPGVRVILQYDPGQGYVTASAQFAQFYQEDIAKHTDLAKRVVRPSGYVKSECGRHQMCDALIVALDYLYTDRPEKARTEFADLYKCPNADEMWNTMVEQITKSLLYAPGDAPKAIVTQASHYMLKLSTDCDQSLPVHLRGPRVWSEGFCIPLDWVEVLLRDIDLVAEGEKLQLVPESHAAERAIAVVDRSNDTRVGTVYLDMTSGFPGEVYRVDDVESDHWRLKSDFIWERVSP